jgi:hypothetical protein
MLICTVALRSHGHIDERHTACLERAIQVVAVLDTCRVSLLVNALPLGSEDHAE